MRDKYNAGQAGAMGPNSSASGNTFQQIWQQNSAKIDLQTLSGELKALRSAMRKEATEPEQDIAIGAIAAAETAAASGDGPRAMENLRAAGKWAVDVSTKIGVGVATAALKSALGL